MSRAPVASVGLSEVNDVNTLTLCVRAQSRDLITQVITSATASDIKSKLNEKLINA